MAKQSKEEKAAIFEDPEAIAESYSKVEEWIKKNKNILLGAAVVIVGAVFGISYLLNSSAEEELVANKKLYPAEFYFGLDSLDAALNGSDTLNIRYGFSKVATKYEDTDAGNLANFYAGVVYLKQGEYKKAISSLEKFSSNDVLIQARAYSLIGDAYMQTNDYSKAVDYFVKASEYKPNKAFTPFYLMKLGVAYIAAGKASDAVVEFEKIEKKYPKFEKIKDVKKYKAYAKGVASSK